MKHTITKKIKDATISEGFSLVGIAKAEPMTTEISQYQEWLRRGFHAGMGYMERNIEKRFDVREILPDARSVIVVAQNYYTPFPHEESDTKGKISRYAWGTDYHEVIPPKLQAICDVIHKEIPDSVTKIYTDTGAVLEKQWAVRAGIGWQGKNGNIISRAIGSWFFLGVIITTAEFDYDSPVQDFCGSCTACLDACPTAAIVEPSVVDARRCISFQTIETKPDAEIPPDVAQNLDGWLFGCDTCQDVCPWNRFQTETSEELFFPRNEETSLLLSQILAMSQEEFSARFRKSPIKRAKKAGLQRNARTLEQA